MMLLAVCMTARAFSFSAVVPTGQTLYFDVTSSSTVSVVNPDWSNHTKPTGSIEIPASVVNNGTTYSVTAIAKRAFQSCTDISRVVVPSGVRTIGTLAFFMCTALDTIELPSTIDSIASEAFNNCGYYNNMANWSDSSALYIGNYLIRVRTSLVGTYTVREGTQGIAGTGLYNCHSLTEVVLPQSMRFIGPLVFKDCGSLDTLQMLGSTPPVLAATAFDENEHTVVKVPCGSLEAYNAAANWSSRHIVEVPCPVGIADIAASEPAIATTGNGITVSGADGHALSVSDIMGRIVASIDNAHGSETIALPHAGVFVVCIEGAAPRKIVYLK